jgi:hypothetical protein
MSVPDYELMRRPEGQASEKLGYPTYGRAAAATAIVTAKKPGSRQRAEAEPDPEADVAQAGDGGHGPSGG